MTATDDTTVLKIAKERDTIRFSLAGEHSLTGETIRMQASVEILVRGRTEDDWRKDLFSTLEKLVKTKWNLSGINRESLAGDEKVSLTATARVGEEEDRNLEMRARESSKAGLTIETPRVDRSFPLHDVEKARQELRIRLAEQAKKSMSDFNKALGTNYTLADISFRGLERAGTASNALRASGSTYSVTGDDGDTSYVLGTSEKIVMVADVTLAY